MAEPYLEIPTSSTLLGSAGILIRSPVRPQCAYGNGSDAQVFVYFDIVPTDSLEPSALPGRRVGMGKEGLLYGHMRAIIYCDMAI